MSKELDARLAALFERCDETDKLIVDTRRFADLESENAKLRELVRDMWRDGMCECDERGACATCEYGYLDRMRELGIEADA